MAPATHSLEKQIMLLGEKHNIAQLQELIGSTSSKTLAAALSAKLGHNDCTTFWNYLLQGFDTSSYDSKEKRFACVKGLLDGLFKVELSYKQTYDLVTRLCQDLNTYPSEQLVEMLEHCVDGIRVGDPKCVGWKDLFPEVLNALATLPQLSVNGVRMSGPEYRDATVRNLCTMRWPSEVLTPIADMFKELHLSPAETVTVLHKFCAALQSLSPCELPALAYQLFSLCSTASQIIIPLLAMEKYFHRFYYKKLFADMNSNSTDFDSIDAFSDKELREAEETILHHLSYCTQYKINEIQMCIVMRNFFFLPDVLLTPFMLSAVIAMSTANREPDTRLARSVLLPFLRSVIKHNEDERTIADCSVWCRDSLERKHVDLEQILTVLIDQNKDGKDTVTPGLVNLAFTLLRTKHSPHINQLAIGFLAKFIRKRFVFGQGIVKKLAEWMVVEQEQNQYAECLTLLSVADTFTVSECVKTINYVMDYFLWISGDQAMRMMSFILPILKISPIVRDAFIEVLRKAMNSSDMRTRRMSVYGFCMILKQLNNSNSQRCQLNVSGMCTQQSISGFSLMSQATLGNRSNPQRHFDMLTLEIIGLLRNCFSQPLEIKCTLYENLQRAVELNPKLVAHVLQFIDWHFRSYFAAPHRDDEDNDFSVRFDKVVHANDAMENEIQVHDNLGRLILLVSHCLVTFESFEHEYDTREMKRLLNASVERVIAKELKFEDTTGSLTCLKNELLSQQLNFIEGLMAYTLLTSKQTTDNIKHLLPLFKAHQHLLEGLKSLSNKKAQKKSKGASDSTHSVPNITINGVVVKKVQCCPRNIWDLIVVEKMLRLLHEDVVPFASRHNTPTLRSNVALVRYVLEVAAAKVENIRLEPTYKQLAHSKRTLKYLTDITKVVYERGVKCLPTLWRDFDLRAASLAAECFHQCLQTANEMYRKKFRDYFVKGFDLHVINQSKESIAVLHDIIDEFMEEEYSVTAERGASDPLMKDTDGRRIPWALFQSLEILYDNITFSDRLTTESYSWLLKFCKQYKLETKEMGIVHKLLFQQRQKTHSGAFFHIIPLHLARIWSAVRDDEDDDDKADRKEDAHTHMDLELKSITTVSAESCLHYLYEALHKQIADVDYFVSKANNMTYKYRIVPAEDRDFCLASLRSLERSICSQLIHISNALLNLTNVCIPLGSCMDGLMKLLMQHYICLKNLAKHFLSCCNVTPISIQGTRFDLLLKVVGKPVPSNVYALITYIESNVLEEKRKRKTDPLVEKAKVLRETKLIPKLILCIENFNKHVILLAKKTNDRLANFLHFGTVRDFRIKTVDLKAAIEKTLSHSSQISTLTSSGNEDEEALLEQMEAESRELEKAITNNGDDDNNGNDDNNPDEPTTSESSSPIVIVKKKLKKKVMAMDENDDDDDDDAEGLGKSETTPEDAEILENESNQESCSQLLKNIAKINAKTAKKRILLQSERQDPDVLCAPPLEPEPKRRRRGPPRGSKKT